MSSREGCERYPCHFDGQDCTFCFCPFYPCLDTSLGMMVEGVWSCNSCTLVHKAEVAEEIVEGLFNDVDISLLWRSIRSQI